ncbi:ArsR/SmtB family transcription factor [Erythrobacter rubeus]|uniref:Winged helix-turn-helix transcriptional regulator n=1 Tax=Erythrobacter rubeus TaxID=2760803 RepID=A0ABR8KUT5_9SPHN|nr:metalloregulator ArsR/SmtB family transcription factor [Erythrobacter rubeus]MBD2842022.1 winged helix-turn-helix transcriptional regulator [Erythrobacter rubeus]
MVDSNASIDTVFRALGEPTRLRMIQELSRGERTIGDLAEPLDMTLAGASKHIGVLEQAGLLTREKRGRERVCRLRPEALLAARDWTQKYSAFWNDRLDALDAAIREQDDE